MCANKSCIPSDFISNFRPTPAVLNSERPSTLFGYIIEEMLTPNIIFRCLLRESKLLDILLPVGSLFSILTIGVQLLLNFTIINIATSNLSY